MLRRSLVAGLALLAFAVPALAQDQGGQGGRRGRAPGGEARRPGIEQMAERVARRLDLTDAQKPKFDEMVARAREKMQSRGGNMRELMRALREAREAGDDARVKDLEAQIQEARSGFGTAMNEFFDEVETILTPEQKETLSQVREDMQRFAGQGGPGGRGGDMRGGPQRMIEDLKTALKLDEEQALRFDELAGELRGRGDGMREIFRELRAAREAGDEAKIAELEDRMQALRDEQASAVDSFMADVETILRDDQKAALAEFRDRMPGRAAGGPLDARTILRAVRRLDLSDEQKEQIRALGDTFQRSEREARRGDREAAAARASDLKSQVKQLLTADQAEEFERILAREQRGRGARGDAPRGEGRPGARGRGGARDSGDKPTDEAPKGQPGGR